MKTIIQNISQLIQVREEKIDAIVGLEMKELPIIENAFVEIEDGIIVNYGPMSDIHGVDYANTTKVINAKGKIVMPTWVDSHTHVVFAGSREKEFVDKINGLSYEDIAKNGGGILNSAKKLHDTSEFELFEQASVRIEEIMGMGTGAVEIKSGYGLSVQDEVKMLRVIKLLKDKYPVTIKSTFLGAHAIPTAYKENRAGYINCIIEDMIPLIAKEGLAEYVDVFCDRGFFTPNETDQILKAGAKYGLIPKIHANELDYSGGIQIGVENNALSVDHLEFTGDEEIKVLMESETMPTLMPSTAFFLGLEYPPARKMIEAGLPVALASDYNPGSSPSGKMAFTVSLACIKLKMTPEEAINAATMNSAYAMGVQNELGSITKGKKANLIITKPLSSYARIPYSFGSDLVDKVLINGKII
ncbi:MAG: imidazolonepropionase [Bacteroidota bacterium]